MRCRVCGAQLEPRISDFPFKLTDTSIVIVKDLPVFQCRQCNDIELDHPVMAKVEQLLQAADRGAELQVLRYAA